MKLNPNSTKLTATPTSNLDKASIVGKCFQYMGRNMVKAH